MYTPLNESEYEILKNGSLYLKLHAVILPTDQYIEFGDGYAFCLDGLTKPIGN